MPRKPPGTQDEPVDTQDGLTRPRPLADNGLVLDEHGLPLSGPARAATLAGRPDPAQPAPPADAAPAPEQEG